MNDPLVSVVILTHFARAATLKRAIASALAQTFHDFEILVVDSGHHPETAAAVQSFNDARTSYHRIPKDTAIGDARNSGVRLARGRHVAFLDDDDEWLPAKLEKQVHLFQTSDLPNLGMVTCPVWIVNDGMGRMRQEPLFERPKRGYLFKEAVTLSGAIPSRATAMIFAKEALIDSALFDGQFLCGEDWDLLIRLTQRWQIDVVREPLALCHYHYRGSRATAIAREIESHKLLIQKHHDLLVSRPQALADWSYLLANDYLRANERHQCRTNAREAMKHRPGLISGWMIWLAALSAPSFWAYRAFLSLRLYLGWRLLGRKTSGQRRE